MTVGSVPAQPSPEGIGKPPAVTAGMWRRFIAFLADLLIVFLIIVAVGVPIIVVWPAVNTAWLNVIGYVALFGYMIFGLAVYHTTPGKYMLGIEVASGRYGEQYPSFWRIFFRETVGRAISLSFFGVGYWRALRNPQRFAWSDQIGDTVVRLRATRPVLRKSLMAFVAFAFVADLGVAGFGVWYQERTARQAAFGAFEQEFGADVASLSAERDAVNRAERRRPASISDYQTQMRGVLPLLDQYKDTLDAINELLAGAFRRNFFPSVAVRKQYSALAQAFVLREEQVMKSRGEANLVVTYDPATERWTTVQSELKRLDSQIDTINQRVSALLAANGLKP